MVLKRTYSDPSEVKIDRDGFIFNLDYLTRDTLLGIQVDWTSPTIHGSVKFRNLSIESLNILMNNKHINPNDRHNNTPPFEAFHAFMSEHPQAQAFGYAISPYRKDYRIDIDGIEVAKEYVTKEMKRQFIKLCTGADELFTENGLYAWWD